MKLNITKIAGFLLFVLVAVTYVPDTFCQNHTIRRPERPTRPAQQVNNLEKKYQKDLAKGESLIENEQYAEAKKHFTLMYAKYPKHESDIKRWLDACDMFIAQQEEQQEEQHLQEEQEQQDYLNAMRTGELLEETGIYEQAEAHYQKMLSSFPDYSSEINARISACQAKIFKTKTFTVNGVSFTMVAVEGGMFTMGATDEQDADAFDNEYPAHPVAVNDFYIGETEVTQRLWFAVMGTQPSYTEDFDNPVESVSWEDCQVFIKKLNSLTRMKFRLPTEAEWEFAARGGNYSSGYKYSGSNLIDNVAWYDCGYPKNVRQKRANELGLYDMTGNVEEFCQDYYGAYCINVNTNGRNVEVDPKGPSVGSTRVCRGGNAAFKKINCRVSVRRYCHSDSKSTHCGLRLCLSK